VLTSPARRCLETADALNKGLKGQHKHDIEIVDYLGTDSSLEALVQHVIKADPAKTLLLVGHQPHLGLLISKLLGMPTQACVVKKGAIWWLRRRAVEEGFQTYLYTVQNPDY